MRARVAGYGNVTSTSFFLPLLSPFFQLTETLESDARYRKANAQENTGVGVELPASQNRKLNAGYIGTSGIPMCITKASSTALRSDLQFGTGRPPSISL